MGNSMIESENGCRPDYTGAMGRAVDGTVTVLIADDDPLVRDVLRMALEELGHEAVEVADGDELLQVVGTSKFGACVMDASMPGASLAFRLEALARTAPSMPLIVLTGYATLPGRLLESVGWFLRKPVDLQTFKRTLESIGLT
jgi:two-component system OmpR family response regulator